MSKRKILLLLLFLPVLQGCGHNPLNLLPMSTGETLPPLRAAQVDLDYVYDPDGNQQQANLEALVDRVKKLGVNTVFLQAFADEDGNGTAERGYFPSEVLPLKEDLFAAVAKPLRRAGVAVYGWLPLLAYDVPRAGPEMYVQSAAREEEVLNGREILRLSPFNPRSRELITTIYRELAGQAIIDGILFHDDGRLSDFEDSSPAALRHYRAIGLPPDVMRIRANPADMNVWSRYKTEYLIDFSLELLAVVRERQPWARSARNLFALPVLEPRSEEWFGQSLPLFLAAYDYTALMAMPFMEEAAEPTEWLARLTRRALRGLQNPNRLVVELQTRDWNNSRPIPAEVMIQQMESVAAAGATSLAYYPDDVFHNVPRVEIIRACFVSPDPCTSRRTSW